MESKNFDFLKNKYGYLSVSAVMFCNNLQLILCTLIGLLSHAIHQHYRRSQHISVLTACTFVFGQVCTIEPSFFKTTSGMHRLPFEGRHLVLIC